MLRAQRQVVFVVRPFDCSTHQAMSPSALPSVSKLNFLEELYELRASLMACLAIAGRRKFGGS